MPFCRLLRTRGKGNPNPKSETKQASAWHSPCYTISEPHMSNNQITKTESRKPTFSHQRREKQTENFKNSKKTPSPFPYNFPQTSTPINMNKQRSNKRKKKNEKIRLFTQKPTRPHWANFRKPSRNHRRHTIGDAILLALSGMFSHGFRVAKYNNLSHPFISKNPNPPEQGTRERKSA